MVAAVRASAGVLLVLARIARPLLLSLGKAKACFCLLAGALELAQAFCAGGPLSVGLCLVELIALAGVLSLRSQIAEVIGRHVRGVEGELCSAGRRGGESAAGESASALGVGRGVVQLVVVVQSRLV